MENVRLVSLEMYQEDEEYFLKAIYRFEDESGVWEETYPKIHLPIVTYRRPLITCEFSTTLVNYAYVNLGFGDLPLKEDHNGVYGERKLVKEKVHDMTISEIEKKLGYRIKIVGEKGE